MARSEKTSKHEFYESRYGKPCEVDSDPRIKKVIQIFSNHQFDNILDIGCGDGSLTTILKDVSNAKEAYGVDISDEILNVSDEDLKLFNLDIDEEMLPFENHFFDAVFCGEIIEHLFNPDHLLKEIHRVLKNNGICVITTPNLASWYNRIALLLGYQPYYTEVSTEYKIGHFKNYSSDVAGHIRIYTCRSLVELMKLYSFEIIKVDGTSEKLPFPFNLGNRISGIFNNLNSNCIIISSVKKNHK